MVYLLNTRIKFTGNWNVWTPWPKNMSIWIRASPCVFHGLPPKYQDRIPVDLENVVPQVSWFPPKQDYFCAVALWIT